MCKKERIALDLPFRKRKHDDSGASSLPVIETSADRGLSQAQAEERAAARLQNLPVEPPTRTLGQIVRSNTLTFFNAIFLILAALLVWARASIFNFSFLVVVCVNAVIGIVQELRSKKALDALTILQAPQARVLREGELRSIPAEELVRDDVVEFSQGDQVCADALVLSGECQVNEALVTGEADEIRKGPGDALLSGSFLINGSVRARLTAVGAESFVNRLTLDAKRQKKIRLRGMMRSLNQLVSIIGILLIPLGAALVYKETEILHRPPVTGVTSAVGAMVGMIPEGLFLLTSMALAAGVLRLARRRTMVRDLGCIETLARVDTLCVDKTGTITENKMVVEDIVPLCPDRFIADDIRLVMADYVHAMQGDNDTMAALRRYFTGQAQQPPMDALPFSSARKYGGVAFHEDETWLLGAPEVLLGEEIGPYKERIDHYSSLGCRVLLLCLYDGQLRDESLTAAKLPVSLILLTNKIRPEAPETFAYFARQEVSVRVISGDNPLTVSEVAKRAGIPGAERWVDARTLQTEEELDRAAADTVVFGRVTPEQKRKLVLALKRQGHTVAMTGDGVNDVLALKEADCSIAMASGSDVACQVSQIVLMDSDFSAMPSVVAEGRRVINNIERSASLFLVKNIFSMIVAVLSLVFALPYPLTPAQLGLVNGTTIGIPSFILAMEPNEERIRGHFLRNVLYRALPAALTNAFLVEGAILFYLAARLPDQTLGTICAGIMGVVGLIMVWRTAQPLNTLRKLMLSGIGLGFVICFLWLQPIFGLVRLDFLSTLILGVFVLLAWPVFRAMERLSEKGRDEVHLAGDKLRSFRSEITK